MSEQKPQVGLIVYVVLPKKNVCVPARIIERVTRESEAGTLVSYILDFGQDGKTSVLSDDVIVDDTKMVFSIEEAEKLLMIHAKAVVDQLISKAVENSAARFSK